MIADKDIQVLESWLPTGYGSGHADFREAAMVMANHPELVAEDRYDAENGKPDPRAKMLLQEGLKINAERLARIFRRVKENEDCVRIADLLPPES